MEEEEGGEEEGGGVREEEQGGEEKGRRGTQRGTRYPGWCSSGQQEGSTQDRDMSSRLWSY